MNPLMTMQSKQVNNKINITLSIYLINLILLITAIQTMTNELIQSIKQQNKLTRSNIQDLHKQNKTERENQNELIDTLSKTNTKNN